MAPEDDSEDTYRAALIRAAEFLGGPGPLAKRLQVSRSDLLRWLEGLDRPSIGTFLEVVDILVEAGARPRLTPRIDG